MDDGQQQGRGIERRPESLPAYPQIEVASTCRSYREYVDMFALDERRLAEGAVLDVAGGASSFTAQLREMGVRGVAVDPFYEGERETVIAAAAKEAESASAKIGALREVYDWSYYGSPERHGQLRADSLARFAADFRRDDASGRYAAAALPHLPFADGAFRTVLCSHFLFLYADRFGEDFHRQALEEMLRVTAPGGEIRVYPLIDLKWNIYPYLQDILVEFGGSANVELLPSNLPFIPVSSPILSLCKR